MRTSESAAPHGRSLLTVATPSRTHTSVSSYFYSKSRRPTQRDFRLPRIAGWIPATGAVESTVIYPSRYRGTGIKEEAGRCPKQTPRFRVIVRRVLRRGYLLADSLGPEPQKGLATGVF